MLVLQHYQIHISFLPNQGVAVDGVIAGGDYPYTLVGIGTDAVITGGGDYTPYWFKMQLQMNNVERPSQQNSNCRGCIDHSSVLKITMQLTCISS